MVAEPEEFNGALGVSVLTRFLSYAGSSSSLFYKAGVAGSIRCGRLGQCPIMFLSFLGIGTKSTRSLYCTLGSAMHTRCRHFCRVLGSKELSRFRMGRFGVVCGDLYRRYVKGRVRGRMVHSVTILYRALDACCKRGMFLLLSRCSAPFVSTGSRKCCSRMETVLGHFLTASLGNGSCLRGTVLAKVREVTGRGVFSNLGGLIIYAIRSRSCSSYFNFARRRMGRLLTCYGTRFSSRLGGVCSKCRFNDASMCGP